MSLDQRTHSHTHGRTVPNHYDFVDAGCRHYGVGGLTVWRLIKAVSQLLVISFAFWSAVTGTLSAQLAFAGMLLAYFGAEGVEAILAQAGKTSLRVTREGEVQATVQGEEDDDRATGGGEAATHEHREGRNGR